MWTRGIVGVALVVLGAVWTAQGTGALHGSSMTGQTRYTTLGLVLLVVGAALVIWAWCVRRGAPRAGVSS